MTPRRPRRSVAAVAFATFCLFLVPGLALAHAELDTVTPADKSTVVGTPAQIKMTFTETLDSKKSSIKLVDPSGSIVDAQSSVPAGGDGKEMDLVVNGELQPGAYTLRWISASAEDGDIAHGTTSFTVIAPSPSPSQSAAPTSSTGASPSSAPSVAPSASPTLAPSPSPAPTAPVASTSDALIPIVVVLAVLAGLGFWLLRGRGRQAS